MRFTLKKLFVLLLTNTAQCSVTGITYIDPRKIKIHRSKPYPGEDPCNPLYWYPRNIPDFCKFGSTIKPTSSESLPRDDPLPPTPPKLDSMLPPGIPLVPMPPPPILSLPPLAMLPLPSPPIIPALPLFPPSHPAPIFPISANPYIPSPMISAFNMLPSPSSYYSPNLRSTAGMVPGLPGLVTKDGGINIMPFSDTYSDMLEKHKNKMIRKKLNKILDRYKYGPYSRSFKNLRKYETYFTDDE